MLVKTCGIQTAEAAKVCLENGSDLIGMIFVPNRSRTVDRNTAKTISQMTQAKRLNFDKKQYFKSLVSTKSANYYHKVYESLLENGPFTVGVFQNQTVDEIFAAVQETDIDIVQLHGSEDKIEYAVKLMNYGIPVISRYLVTDLEDPSVTVENVHLLILIDSAKGGDGKTVNWEMIKEVNKEEKAKFLLAGGLKPENVTDACKIKGVIGVDVSSGIEVDGVKNTVKIIQFIGNAKLQ